jgi:hypothetical protein
MFTVNIFHLERKCNPVLLGAFINKLILDQNSGHITMHLERKNETSYCHTTETTINVNFKESAQDYVE